MPVHIALNYRFANHETHSILQSDPGGAGCAALYKARILTLAVLAQNLLSIDKTTPVLAMRSTETKYLLDGDKRQWLNKIN